MVFLQARLYDLVLKVYISVTELTQSPQLWVCKLYFVIPHFSPKSTSLGRNLQANPETIGMNLSLGPPPPLLICEYDTSE